ncbi:MAG: hypothetical protein Ct9H300mP25_01300 [Acidobacteriota bacterium]|nr:MAG: hypothetical protein Ct9H300mP25_01300 [Acidobacteriota bacterium]
MVDRALLIEPMRRWRDWQCRRADLIVTPRREIVPPWVPPERIIELEWGADTTRFTPDALAMSHLIEHNRIRLLFLQERSVPGTELFN